MQKATTQPTNNHWYPDGPGSALGGFPLQLQTHWQIGSGCLGGVSAPRLHQPTTNPARPPNANPTSMERKTTRPKSWDIKKTAIHGGHLHYSISCKQKTMYVFWSKSFYLWTYTPVKEHNYWKGTWFEDLSLPISTEDVWLLDSIDLSCFLMFIWSVWPHSNADIPRFYMGVIAISGDWRRALLFKLTHLSRRITVCLWQLPCMWWDNTYVLLTLPETIAKPTEPLPGRYSKRKRFFSAHIF